MNENEIYILNPDYSFKTDKDRIVMYSKEIVQEYSTPDWVGFIHPLQAKILDEFTNPICLSEQCMNLSHKYGITPLQAKEMIVQYIKNETLIYTEFNGIKIVFPKNILIPIHFVKGRDICRRPSDIALNDGPVDLTPDRMHSAPQSLLFMLTAKCATSCKYCYADKKTQYTALSTQKILDIIDEAHSLNMSYINVIGGEVFCRKDWDVILSKLVECDLCPNYISTKYPLTENMVKKLYETRYNNVVQISLDSLTPSILQNLIGVTSDYVNKIKQTITYLEKYKFKIQINTILTRTTAIEIELEKLYDFVKNIKGLYYWEIRVPEKSIYSSKSFDEVKAPRMQLEKICNYVKKALIPKANFKIICSEEALNEHLSEGKSSDECFVGGTCGTLQNKAFILPDGKVSICEQMYWHPQFIIGDLKSQSLQEVWNSSKAKELFNMNRQMFRKESKCHSCQVADFCNQKHRRCFVKIIRAYGRNNWDYPDPRCEFAPKAQTQY